jgi:hypothetical protein
MMIWRDLEGSDDGLIEVLCRIYMKRPGNTSGTSVRRADFRSRLEMRHLPSECLFVALYSSGLQPVVHVHPG